MGAKLNCFYRVDITLAAFNLPQRTISLVNKTLKDSASLVQFWPILLDVGEVSFTASDVLPTLSLSSITIDNRRGRFGANRRFQDILQRYSVIDLPVTVYFGLVDNTTDTVTSWTQIASGVVSNVQCALNGAKQTLTFNIKPYRFDERVMTLEVARTVTGMENAPDASLGRAVPLVFGPTNELVPVRITADGGSTASYAVGTGLYNHLKAKLSVTPELWTKNDIGQWERVLNNFTDRSAQATTGTYTLDGYAGRALGVGETGKTGLCIGVTLQCAGNGTGTTSTARLTVFLLKYNLTTFRAEEVAGATGTVDLSLYDASNNAGTSSFPVSVSFDQPVFLSASYGYAIGWTATGVTADDLSIRYISNAVTTSPQFFRNVAAAADSYGFDWLYSPASVISNTPLRAAFRYLTPTYTEQVSYFSQQGLTYSKMTLTPSGSPGSGQTDPPLDNLPVGLKGVTGLATYAGSAVVSSPDQIAEYLSYTWNSGTATFSASNTWDGATLASSHYQYLYEGVSATYRSRAARGVIDQKATFSQVIGEVARGTASRVGILSTGKAFMYPFGVTVTPAAHIPAHDITGLAWEVRDSANIVNRAVINLGRRYLIGDVDALENAGGYVYTTDFSASNFPAVAGLTLESRTMWGNKDLAATSFPVYAHPTLGSAVYLGDSNSYGSILAEYYLGRYGKPLTYCSFVVPYLRYLAVRMFDVITFASTDFPSYFGTDPEAKPGCVDVAGAVSAVPGANYGEELVRAETYRGLVEGVSFILAMDHAPSVRLTVQVLVNHPSDPT